MTDFLFGCGSLFTSIFNAAYQMEYFALLFALLGFRITYGLFCHMSSGLKKM